MPLLFDLYIAPAFSAHTGLSNDFAPISSTPTATMCAAIRPLQLDFVTLRFLFGDFFSLLLDTGQFHQGPKRGRDAFGQPCQCTRFGRERRGRRQQVGGLLLLLSPCCWKVEGLGKQKELNPHRNETLGV
jgi:hypothetical protein